MTKTYSEMIKLKTFEERLAYLKLDGFIGDDTFGFDRYLNQKFYKTKEWKDIRNRVIARDNGCDLACSDYYILGDILIHHINPISKEDIINRSYKLFDMNNLVCVSKHTHNIIHYGSNDVNNIEPIARKQNDTCPWRH